MKNYIYRFTIALSLLISVFLWVGVGSTREQGIVVKQDTKMAVPGVNTIVTRMERAQAENLANSWPYTVIRDYKVFGKAMDKSKAHVIATVKYIPPDSKSFVIRLSGGSSLAVGLIRRVLKNETRITKNPASASIDRENYDFRFNRVEMVSGHRCYVLELIPKLKKGNLLRGYIKVDAQSYLIRYIEGSPDVSPSWWLRDLSITLHYGDVNGMWLLSATEVAVSVRLLGRHTMTMEARDAVYKLTKGTLPQSGQ